MPEAAVERPTLSIESRILLVRGQKVMLDSDLAELYGVPTGRLNEAVKRNRRRFPEDFMFQLTRREGREVERIRSQVAILKRGQHRKYAPYVFTEQGIAMLSSVLTSERAIAVNIRALAPVARRARGARAPAGEAGVAASRTAGQGAVRLRDDSASDRSPGRRAREAPVRISHEPGRNLGGRGVTETRIARLEAGC